MTTKDIGELNGISRSHSFRRFSRKQKSRELWLKMSQEGGIKEEKEEMDLESEQIHETETKFSTTVNDEGSISNAIVGLEDVTDSDLEGLTADKESSVKKKQVTVSETDDNNAFNVPEEASQDSDTNRFSSMLITNLKQQTKTDTGQSNTKVDHLGVSKAETIVSPARRKSSLTVPNTFTSGTELNLQSEAGKKDSELSTERQGSKLSLYSQGSISRRSPDYKFDYTTIIMPAEDKRNEFSPEESWIRVAIPYLPLKLSVTCLILNIIIPGSGTILSGFSIFCCAKSRVPIKYDQDAMLVLCVNTWVGFAQFFTVTFLLVGWFWSLAWGIRMILLSLEQREIQKQERERQLKVMAVSAMRRS